MIMIIFKTTLLYGKTKVKFDDVSAALVNHEYRKKDRNTYNYSSEALVVRGQFNDRKSNKRDKFRSKLIGKISAKDKCAFCHQKGYWKNDCLKLKNKERESRF